MCAAAQNPSSRSPTTLAPAWHEANRAYLLTCLAEMRQLLEQAIAHHTLTNPKFETGLNRISTPPPTSPPTSPPISPPISPLTPPASHTPQIPVDAMRSALLQRLALRVRLALFVLSAAVGEGSALNQLCLRLGLSRFERWILLLCAGVELESAWAPLCAMLHGDPQRNYVTFGLALAHFPTAHWSALTPSAPLRRWQLIHLDPDRPLTSTPLRIDERILHHLLGLNDLDEAIADLVDPVTDSSALVPSHQSLARQMIAVWQATLSTTTDPAIAHLFAPPSGVPPAVGQAPGAADHSITSDPISHSDSQPILQLCGSDRAGKMAIAVAVCRHFGLQLYRLPAFLLPTQPRKLQEFLRRWQRETWLSPCALLLDLDRETVEPGTRNSALMHVLDGITGPVLVCHRDRQTAGQRPMITFEIHQPTAQEQRGLWRSVLGDQAAAMNGQIDGLVSQFDLTAPMVRAIGQSVLQQVLPLTGQPSATSSPRSEDGSVEEAHRLLTQQLWQTCRRQARPQLEDLAQAIATRATWEDLILPLEPKAILREIAAHVRQRSTVYDHWGFGQSGRGLGISVLFAGASGTGKTMAAEVLANTLQLDLYRIDLSAVVSKYIGETEKNLRRVFDAAEVGGAILLFDEADALFGKRSEVKDSHDRHANIEVSYLLQRMEAYRGLAILTTNLKDALDQAFLRRIRFTVRFPFPDAQQREEIWRRVFPAEVPTVGLSPAKLARLNVAGGNIRNIALNAAFLAADAGEPVMMKHLLEAARSEYIKIEKPLVETEIKGWIPQ